MIFAKIPRSLLVSLALSTLAAPAPAGPAAATPVTTGAPALEPVLAGEFALQDGDFREAGRRYLQAAEAVPDAGLAERATRIALLGGDDAGARRALARWRALAPATPGVVAAGAALALRSGDRGAARADLLTLLAQPGNDGWQRALQTLAAAKPDIAGDTLAELVQRDALPNRLDAWLAFGGMAQQLDRADVADQIVAGVVRKFPGEPRAALLDAGRLRKQGDREGARAAIARALAGAPADAAVRIAAAGEFDALGDPKAAAATLAGGMQDADTYAVRANYLSRAGDAAGLAALYDEVKAGAGKPDPAQRLLLGQLAEFLKRPDEALAWYRGVAVGPARDQARLRIAVVLAGEGDLAGARAQLAELQDSEADGELQRDSYLLESDLLVRRDRAAEALDAVQRGLNVFETDAELLYARALIYERLDRLAESERDLRVVIAAEPDNADALNALGYTLADRTDRYREAQGYIEQALALRPDAPAILDSLGWVLYRQGQVEQALPHLERAYAQQKDAEIAAHLGEVLWVSGRHDAARVIWGEGAAMDADNRALNRALERFQPGSIKARPAQARPVKPGSSEPRSSEPGSFNSDESGSTKTAPAKAAKPGSTYVGSPEAASRRSTSINLRSIEQGPAASDFIGARSIDGAGPIASAGTRASASDAGTRVP